MAKKHIIPQIPIVRPQEAAQAYADARSAAFPIQARNDSPAPDPVAALTGQRGDGWSNLYSGLGRAGRDAIASTIYEQRPPLTMDIDRAMYRQNWLCGLLVDDLVRDCFRAGWKIGVTDETQKANTETLLHAEWLRVNAFQVLGDGLRWSLVFGGAVGLLYTDDAAKYTQANIGTSTTLLGGGVSSGVVSAMAMPLELDALKEVLRILVVDAQFAIPNIGTLDADPRSANFGLPMYYSVTPYGLNTATYQVHWTRLLRFPGVPTDNLTRISNLTWGDSIFERVYDAVMRYGVGMAGAAQVVSSFEQGVLKVKDLNLLLGSNQEQKIVTRTLAFKMGLSFNSLALIDAENEEYTRVSARVTGLADLLNELKLEAIGAMRMPKSKVFGSQQGELAGAEADQQTWQQQIHGWQMYAVHPPLVQLSNLLIAAKLGPFKGVFPIGLSIEPNGIVAPDATKEAAIRKVTADTDAIYIDRNVVEPSEIANSRFGGAAYSTETTLDPALTDARNSAAATEQVGEGGEPTGENTPPDATGNQPNELPPE